MTGVNRFLYENEHLGWSYNRTENLKEEDLKVFTHLFTENEEDLSGFKMID